jgi:hypothetical protein
MCNVLVVSGGKYRCGLSVRWRCNSGRLASNRLFASGRRRTAWCAPVWTRASRHGSTLSAMILLAFRHPNRLDSYSIHLSRAPPPVELANLISRQINRASCTQRSLRAQLANSGRLSIHRCLADRPALGPFRPGDTQKRPTSFSGLHGKRRPSRRRHSPMLARPPPPAHANRQTQLAGLDVRKIDSKQRARLAGQGAAANLDLTFSINCLGGN